MANGLMLLHRNCTKQITYLLEAPIPVIWPDSMLTPKTARSVS